METIKNGLIITKENPIFDNLRFVVSALSKDPFRDAINCLLVQKEDGILNYVATDGRRLHMFSYDIGMFDAGEGVAPEVLEAGMYRLISVSTKALVLCLNDIEVTYPAWKKVIPDVNTDMTDNVTSKSLGKLMIRCKSVFDPAFLNQALGLNVMKEGSSIYVDFGQEDSNSPLLVEHELGTAVLMPMYYEGEESEEDEKEKDDKTFTFSFVQELDQEGDRD